MASRIIVDKDKSNVTTADVPAFPWFRFDAEQFISEEALIDGNYVNLHFSGMGRPNCRERLWSKYTQSNSTIYRYRFHSFELGVDGQLLHDHWLLESEQVTKTPQGCDELQMSLRDERWPVRVIVHTRLDGTAFLERWLEIENLGAAPLAISHLSPWCGLLFMPTDQTMWPPESYEFSLGRYRHLSGCMEGEFGWQRLPEGTYKEELNKLVKFAPCFYLARNEDTAEVVVIDFEYSGGTCVEFTRVSKPTPYSHLHARVGVAGTTPFRVVEPGGKAASPRVHISMLYGDADTCANALFKHLRASVLPSRPWPVKHPVGYHYGGYVNPHWLPTKPEIIRNEIDLAATLGAELFMVDAGWNVPPGKRYPEVFGDWEESALLQNGLRGCFDYARQKGMQCGLWVPIEIVGTSSSLLASHPEWCLRDGQRRVLMLDLTQPEVEQYMFEKIASLIERYQLACFRIDGGPELYCSWDRPDGRFLENAAWRYYDALYRVFDRVRERFPNVMLENCWGGGGRIDLGIMRRFHWVQYSDNWHPEEQLRTLNGLTFSMPPDQCLSFIGAINMNPSEVDFCIRAGLFGELRIVGVAPSVAKHNEAALLRWQHAVKLYKDQIRPLLSSCRVFHQTPLQEFRKPGDWVVLEYASEDASSAVVGLFRLQGSQCDTFTFIARGLDIAKQYEVWFDNHQRRVVMSGRELSASGLPVRLAGAMTSELLVIRGVSES